MNANFLRTIMAVLTVIVGAVATIGGCTTDSVSSVVTCSASWLTPQLMGIFVMALGAAHVVLKLLNGWVGLVNKTVPVVQPSEAKPGVVTPAQVASSGQNK